MKLKGFSGCKLDIIETGTKKFVKKISANKNYNVRLQRQQLKQSEIILDGFNACHVYDFGTEDGLFYFLMDYVQGKTLAEEMFDINLYKIDCLAEKLLNHAINYEKPNYDAELIFDKKISDLHKNLFRVTRLNEIFLMLKNFSWQYVIPSKCHGDLTLENIIVSEDNLTPIDYLDSFYDSWMLDAAKILQDADIMWSYRYAKINSNLIVRLTVMRDLIIKKIKAMHMGGELLETVYMLLLLNLIRIYPYVKDCRTENFLNAKVAYIANKIKNREWEG